MEDTRKYGTMLGDLIVDVVPNKIDVLEQKILSYMEHPIDIQKDGYKVQVFESLLNEMDSYIRLFGNCENEEISSKLDVLQIARVAWHEHLNNLKN